MIYLVSNLGKFNDRKTCGVLPKHQFGEVYSICGIHLERSLPYAELGGIDKITCPVCLENIKVLTELNNA